VTTTPEMDGLLKRLRGGETGVLGELIDLNREPLRRMINLRLDARLAGRISCSDVLQDVYLDAMQRVGHFLQKPELPFQIWLRMIASQRLVDVHRQHLGAQMRNAACEVSLQGRVMPAVSSVSLAACLTAEMESPSQVLMRKELIERVETALEAMDPIDREVLTMRHFEELNNDDVAEILGISKAAASNRYVRALKRLKEIVAD